MNKSKKLNPGREYIIKHPDKSFENFCKKTKNLTKIDKKQYGYLKSYYKKNNLNSSKNITSSPKIKRFKKSMMTVISQIHIPTFKDKTEALKWVDSEILQKINNEQSGCTFSISKNIDDTVIELRMQTR